MKLNVLTGALLLTVGVGVGFVASHLPSAVAAPAPSSTELSHQQFLVSIDEIRQNFVFGHKFTGHYATTVTMSDGSKRHIDLTPMIRNGTQVVELKDNSGQSYMCLNGTTTNGKLMIQVRDVATANKELKADGWPSGAHL